MNRPDWHTPVALLRLADMHMRSLQPAMKAHFTDYGRQYRARFDYPGVLLVFDAWTGELIAKSLPGRPTKPAKARGVRHVRT